MIGKSSIALLVFATLTANCLGQRPRRAQAARPIEGVTIDRDIVYTTVGADRELRLDLYRPKANDGKKAMARPLVFWVHGGGWRAGSKNSMGPAAQLLKHGYAVASIEYRLSHEAIFPAQIADCKAAVSFMRGNATKYGVDPQRFGAWGSSAGGHLVAMLGTTGNDDGFNIHPISKKTASNVQAVCDWFGPTDFLRMNDVRGAINHNAPKSPESLLIGGPIQENKDKVQRANPIMFVDKQDPPFLIMHGDKDRLVPFGQSELLHAALQKSEVSTTLHKVVGGGHGFGGSQEPREKIIERSIEFFNKTLKVASSPGPAQSSPGK